jgi:hypothetical protein
MVGHASVDDRDVPPLQVLSKTRDTPPLVIRHSEGTPSSASFCKPEIGKQDNGTSLLGGRSRLGVPKAGGSLFVECEQFRTVREEQMSDDGRDTAMQSAGYCPFGPVLEVL